MLLSECAIHLYIHCGACRPDRTKVFGMQRRHIILFSAAVLAAAAAIWFYFQSTSHNAETKSQDSGPAQLNNRELRFAPGSPQLSFIKVEAVQALPEPLLDPLNARVAYDE